MNSHSLKTGKSVDFKKALPYCLSPVSLSVWNADGSRQHTAKNKLNDILLQDLENHTYEGPKSLQEYAIVVDMIALTNTILNKSSAYSEFAESFVNRIPKGYGRVGRTADCYKTKSIKSLVQLLRRPSEKIHIALLLSKVPSDFHNRKLWQHKTTYWAHIWIYWKKK